MKKLPADAPVLIVEDDIDTREALAIILRDVGFAVSTVTNGKDALAVLRDGMRPSVIALDLQLPIIDGETVLHEMNADDRLAEIPVVVTTGRASREPIPAYPNVRAILRKPFPFLRLINAISEARGN